MNLFETVKSAVTVKQAAEYYGCKVNRGDMICCPFHDDRHPSMKLNRDYFYCFGCGAPGDVIDFVARLFGLSSYEAAKKLAYDFGIDPDKPPAAMALKKPYPLAQAFRNDEIHCQRVLCDHLHLLERQLRLACLAQLLALLFLGQILIVLPHPHEHALPE